MITVKNLTFNHGKKILFDSVTFTVGNGQKVGLAGPNGAGKSTLFRILTGTEQYTSGQIILDGKAVLVPQEVKSDPALNAAKNIREYIDPENKKDDFELLQMTDNMELPNIDLYSKIVGLSGGQKTKLAIIRALIMEPDVLLLDEPTNFLDYAGKSWVMNFLSNYPKTLILVSHDMILLDRVISKVIAIVPHKKGIEEYKGNYTKYLKLTEEHTKELARKVKVQKTHIKRMEKSLQTLYKYTSDKGVRQRVMLSRRIDRMKDSLPQLPPDKNISITLPTPDRIGEIPIRTIGISKSFGEKNILNNFSFSLLRGERVGLIGPNGAGKSTLVKMLVGTMTPDNGGVIRAENLKIGYYSQEFQQLEMEKSLLETLKELTNQPEGIVRSFLAGFLFTGERVFQSVKSLSGGEKTRLSIALLLLQNYNVLVLDEPTTYLDVLSQRVILEALKKYTGAMVIVTHTEDFMKELKPNRVIFMPEQKVEHWIDNYLEKVSVI